MVFQQKLFEKAYFTDWSGLVWSGLVWSGELTGLVMVRSASSDIWKAP